MEELTLSAGQTASAEKVAQDRLIKATQTKVEVITRKETAGGERIKILVAGGEQEVKETGR